MEEELGNLSLLLFLDLFDLITWKSAGIQHVVETNLVYTVASKWPLITSHDLQQYLDGVCATVVEL